MNLSSIRQLAMDGIDEQVNQTTGKFSVAWWNRKINQAKDVLAQETGYYVKQQPVATYANTQEAELPPALCWGVLGVTYDDAPLTAEDLFIFNEESSGWQRTAPGTPQAYAVQHPNLILRAAPDRTVVPGLVILGSTVGAAFTNQPANDGVEVVSSSASDTTQTVDIYGTTFRTNTVVKETITLTGVTAVSTTKTDWDYILGVELSATCAGTITIREASADATITTITAGNTTSGISAITGSSSEAGEVRPVVSADTTSRTLVGLVGTDEDGAALTDNCVALPGVASNVQPWNDSIKLTSSSASDTQVATIYGATYGTQHTVSEAVTLTGISAATSSKTDWGEITEIELATAAVGAITIAESSGSRTIATIAATGTETLIPATSSVLFPNAMQTVTKALLGAVPAATRVTVQVGSALYIYGGALPPDLAVNTDMPVGLPSAFHYLLAEGADALADVADLYNVAQQGRVNIHGSAFWNGVAKLRGYLNNMQRERAYVTTVDTSLHWDNYNR